MFNLDNYMDNRGLFKKATFGNTTLEVVSLGKDLIKELKLRPTHELMIDFIAEYGLAWNGVRISESAKADVLDVIYDNSAMKEAKDDIVKLVCELSEITELVADKLEAEELAAEELAAKEKLDADEEEAHEENDNLIKKALADTPDILLTTLAADMNAHSGIN